MLVHVVIALIAILGFTAIVVDYGVLWVSRTQAQSAADAAALAGALQLAFDPTPDGARARAVAANTGTLNFVWGQAPNIDPATDVLGPMACPPDAPGVPDTCIRVNVYRNQEKDPLPTFFGRVLGITEQGVKAMAMAQVIEANAAECMRPWAIPDRWLDIVDVTPPIDTIWTWDDAWERYDHRGVLLDPADVYIPPGPSDPGSSFLVPDDIGTQVRLKVGNPQQTLSAGWFFPVDLPVAGGPASGAERYRYNIANCNHSLVKIGDLLWNEPGNMIGPTVQGVTELIGRDPGAYWAGTGVAGGCMEAGTCGMSPRLVPVPVFNPDAYSLQDKTGGRFQLQVTNILGMFVEGMQGNDVMGRLTYYPGTQVGGGTIDPNATFIRTVALVR